MTKLDIKEIKKKSRKNLKKNFLMSIVLIFLFTIIINDSYTSSSLLISQSKETIYVKNLLYDEKGKKITLEKVKEKKQEIKARRLKENLDTISQRLAIGTSPFYKLNYALILLIHDHKLSSGMVSLITAIVSIAIFFLLKLIIVIGKNRFYLESRNYKKTRLVRLLFPYKTKRILKLSYIMFIKRLFQTLWSITIVGGFVKLYEYKMIPYILAENPTINKKEAFNLSKEMMDGYKWQAFLIDVSFIGWYILGLFTFGLSNLLYFNAYREFVYAELYAEIRNNKLPTLTHKKLLNDTYLFNNKNKLDIYPQDKLQFPTRKLDINTHYNQNYSTENLILIFFSASFIGYFWEVVLHLIQRGEFANRGTMIGPWLPIYGAGAILMLLCLKPLRKKPIIYFFTAMILSGIVEYSTSVYLEYVMHMKWWDYKRYFLNLNGRICLEGLIMFGLGGVAITYFIGPLLNSLFNKINKKVINIICCILLVIFGIDFIYSTVKPNSGKGISSQAYKRINFE